MENHKYKIIRYYQNEKKSPYTVRRNLTLAQAQEHCNDPETSSMTATKPLGCENDQRQIERWHKKNKHWFDGYSYQ